MNAHRYPVGASLAGDFLSIMASSVSSEHAFSSAGFTITKHCNCLQGDIVEALQFLKCIFHHDLIFQEHETTAATDSPQGEEDGEEMAGWDGLVDSDGDYDIL